MKLILLVALPFLFINSVWAQVQTDVAKTLCGSAYPEKRVLAAWSKDSGSFDRESEGYCATVLCSNGQTQLTRKKCFKQNEQDNFISVTYQDEISDGKMVTSHGETFDVLLHEGEVCLSECLPVEKKVLGLRVKTESGLDRQSCRDCFSLRKDRDYDGSFLYQEIGKRIYPGQKCFDLCRDPKGKILAEHVLSPACRACTGVNSLVSEEFYYLKTNKGTCLEVDSSKGIRAVSGVLCKSPNRLDSTDFIEKTSWGLFSGRTTGCFEVDHSTQGKVYSHTTSMDDCRGEPINDSERDEGNSKFKAAPTTPESFPGRSSSQ